jgi:hypothetical protein
VNFKPLKLIPIFEQILDKYTSIMKNTSQEYDNVIAICRSLFINKMTDYEVCVANITIAFINGSNLQKAKNSSLQENSSKSKRRRNRIHRYYQLSLMALIQLELG